VQPHHAVAELIKKGYPIKYTLVGDGREKQNIKRLIARLGIEKYVTLTGKCTHEELVPLLHDSHIFLLPSVTGRDGNQEGIPNALKEAMAVGLPVVSTYHAGIPELICDGKSGFLVPERDVAALVRRLKYLVRFPHKRKKFGSSGARIVRELFEKNKETKKLERILQDLTAGRSRREPCDLIEDVVVTKNRVDIQINKDFKEQYLNDDFFLYTAMMPYIKS